MNVKFKMTAQLSLLVALVAIAAVHMCQGEILEAKGKVLYDFKKTYLTDGTGITPGKNLHQTH